MLVRRFWFVSAAVLAVVVCVPAIQAEVRTEVIEYEVHGESFTGYLAYDDRIEGKRPGVLVVHEWWGHNEFARTQAEKLAEEGYAAFALDMFGSGKQAEHPEEAGAFAAEAMGDADAVLARFNAAAQLLREQEMVDEGKIAAQGYCFGGTVVLNVGRSGADLRGVVSYHGSLGGPVDAEPGSIQARVLAFTGGADPMVPPEQVADFVKEMQEVRADFTLVSFPEAKHSFTNPDADEYAEQFDMPVAYDPDAADRAWRETLHFYRVIFSK